MTIFQGSNHTVATLARAWCGGERLSNAFHLLAKVATGIAKVAKGNGAAASTLLSLLDPAYSYSPLSVNEAICIPVGSSYANEPLGAKYFLNSEKGGSSLRSSN